MSSIGLFTAVVALVSIAIIGVALVTLHSQYWQDVLNNFLKSISECRGPDKVNSVKLGKCARSLLDLVKSDPNRFKGYIEPYYYRCKGPAMYTSTGRRASKPLFESSAVVMKDPRGYLYGHTLTDSETGVIFMSGEEGYKDSGVSDKITYKEWEVLQRIVEAFYKGRVDRFNYLTGKRKGRKAIHKFNENYCNCEEITND